MSEANIKARNQRFACIILDIRLEKGTGDQVVIPIRASKEHVNHTTPILLTSSHLDKDLIIQIGKSIQGAFIKPYSMDELLKKVAALIASDANAVS